MDIQRRSGHASFSTAVALVLLALLLAACGGRLNVPTEIDVPVMDRDVPGGNPQRGRELVFAYGCGACHTVPGVPGANAVVGPPLDNFHQRRYIAGNAPNNWQTLMQWIQDPQSIEPGTAMPDVGVTEEDALDIVAYLYNQTPLQITWPGAGMASDRNTADQNTDEMEGQTSRLSDELS